MSADAATVPDHLVEHPVANDVRPTDEQTVSPQDDERELDPRVSSFLRFAVETAVQMLLEERAEARHDGSASSAAKQAETNECTPTIFETKE